MKRRRDFSNWKDCYYHLSLLSTTQMVSIVELLYPTPLRRKVLVGNRASPLLQACAVSQTLKKSFGPGQLLKVHKVHSRCDFLRNFKCENFTRSRSMLACFEQKRPRIVKKWIWKKAFSGPENSSGAFTNALQKSYTSHPHRKITVPLVTLRQ